jgi:CHRD domain/PEP-CTERM motif
MTLTLKVVAAAAGLALSLPSLAHITIYEAPLLGSSEVPAVVTNGSGTARVTIDHDEMTMRIQASFTGLTGTVTQSHIHCCVAPGTNVGVAFGSGTLAGFPLGATFGTYDPFLGMDNRTISTGNWTANFFNGAGGSTPLGAFNALVAGLDAGTAYLNIHTSFSGPGEIRGLLVPVPEPETYALMLAGLAGVLTIARRKKQQA